MRESSIERRLSTLVQRAGGISVKIPPVAAGAPDRLILLPVGQMFLVETKAPGGSLRPIQRAWHERAAKAGITVHVLSSKAEVEEWVRVRSSNNQGTMKITPPDDSGPQRGNRA